MATELTDLLPWMARKVVRWAARVWTTDTRRASGYEEEWTALIEARPGKVFKLFTALGFALGAARQWQRRALADSRYRSHGMTLARYTAVLSSQPALPLLAFGYVKGPAGWALVLGLLAQQNALVARVLERYRGPMRTGSGIATNDLSETLLWELAWLLHGLAIGAAGVYALSALLTSIDLGAGTRAGMTLLFVSLVGLFGSLMLRRRPLGDLAAGAFTLAVIGSAARVAFVAAPYNAILVIAVVVYASSLSVRGLPAESRRGPQFATALALGVLTIFVIGYAMKAAFAPVVSSLPVWRADLDLFQERVAERAGAAGWELVITVALLTASAALALPPFMRREGLVAGAALVALVTPASLGLGWVSTLSLLVVSAMALSAIKTVAMAKIVAVATVVGLAAIGVALARPWSTAAVLGVLIIAGAVVARRHTRGKGSQAPTRFDAGP